MDNSGFSLDTKMNPSIIEKQELEESLENETIVNSSNEKPKDNRLNVQHQISDKNTINITISLNQDNSINNNTLNQTTQVLEKQNKLLSSIKGTPTISRTKSEIKKKQLKQSPKRGPEIAGWSNDDETDKLLGALRKSTEIVQKPKVNNRILREANKIKFQYN